MRKRVHMLRFAGAVVLVAACLAASPQTAVAGPILKYIATDLPDVVPGQDLWQYDYSVSGIAFLQHQGFDVFFSPDRYSGLDATSPNPVDWDVLVIQPDPALPDDGIDSAIANVANPALATVFSIKFVWKGNGTPGAQPFEINQYDALHDVILGQTAHGQTSRIGAVPEPATLVLMGCGLGCAAYRRLRRGA